MDAAANGNLKGFAVGTKVILLATFIGGPHNMKKHIWMQWRNDLENLVF